MIRQRGALAGVSLHDLSRIAPLKIPISIDPLLKEIAKKPVLAQDSADACRNRPIDRHSGLLTSRTTPYVDIVICSEE
jgi:hypothetical protein